MMPKQLNCGLVSTLSINSETNFLRKEVRALWQKHQEGRVRLLQKF